jgi:hypothetical protein
MRKAAWIQNLNSLSQTGLQDEMVLRYVTSRVKHHIPVDGLQQRGELDEEHGATIGGLLATKADTTKDLDLMFSKRVKVNFRKDNKGTLLNGRWCLTCK